IMRSWTSVPLLALSFTLPALAGSVDEARHREAVYYADAYADHYHLPRELVHAIITQESGWNQTARSSLGAIGLMQLMPATALRFAVLNPILIQDNIGGGVRYLAALNGLFRGDLRLVVAAYYCGEHNIERRGLAYSNPDVLRYVESVQARYHFELKLHHSSLRKGE